MNHQHELLKQSKHYGTAPSTLKLLESIQDLGPCVFVSPDKSCVMTINGAYLNIFLWNRTLHQFDCQECRSNGSIESMYDLTLRQIDQFAKESYVWFMESWFDIDIDPRTLED